MFNFLSKKFADVFEMLGSQKTLTEQNSSETITQIEQALLSSDVPYDVVQAFIADLKKDLVGVAVNKKLKLEEHVARLVYEKIVGFLGGQQPVAFAFQIPSVVLVMGLQGSGKTTTIAKLAHYVQTQAQKKGKTRSILLASVDFYRPAAIDQLEILSGQIKADFYRATSTNVLKAVQEIYAYYKENRYELLLLDTAGRLHVDEAMLGELKQIDNLVSPRHKILVLDAMTGQQSLQVAQSFNTNIGFDYAILSKMDSDARGGAAFSFRYALKKSILFVGTGEKVDDLQQFFPDRMAQRMLSFGDMQTLMERAQDKWETTEQEKSLKSLLQGTFTIADFGKQMEAVNQMGSLGQLVQYLPGMAHKVSSEQLDQGQRDMKKFRAIIDSMTPKERQNAVVLDGSRKKRIALGAGVTEKDVTLFIERFELAKQFAKMMTKSGPFKSLFR